MHVWFTLTLVKQPTKTPKLQARAIIPFGMELVDAVFDDREPEECAATVAMNHLYECCEALHGRVGYKEKLALHTSKISNGPKGIFSLTVLIKHVKLSIYAVILIL